MNHYGHEGFDQASYEMGIIGCFSEMVAARLKKIAFSTPIAKENLPAVELAAKELTDSYHIRYYIEEIVENSIWPNSCAQGKSVFIIYEDEQYLNGYFDLKAEQEEKLAAGTYTDAERETLTKKLSALLGYSSGRMCGCFDREEA